MMHGNEPSHVRSRAATGPARPGVQAPASTSSTDPLGQLIERENLDDTIYARIRLMIAERRVLPGERINVDRIARNLGVSRTPVVNALKRLGQEHVVEWVLRRGAFVRQFTTRELARLFEVREMLEGLAARRAAERISRDEVDRLAARFRALELSDHGPALERYIAEDRAFHLRLLALADNTHLTHATESVNLMVFTYQMGLARPPAETVKEHWTILAALRKHDPEASEAAMRLHLRRSRERLDQLADAEERQAGTERADSNAGVRSPRMRPRVPGRTATT
jgi:DNA-binding GntR family transcriptional regulator